MRVCFRVVTIATLLAALPAAVWAQGAPGTPAAKPAEAPPSAAAPQPATPAEQAHVDGFRSTKWGMTEAQVRGAIHADFNIPDDKIKHTENLAEKTQVVSAVVPDLLEGAGNAEVSYIFGYTSKKLIQVNVLWGTAVDAQATPDKMVAAADQLRLLFLDSGYQPGTITANAKMADGSILVFQGQDADKHTTLLRLAAGTTTPSGRNGKPEKPVAVAALSLSYILDATAPDIYRVKKGLF
jgi:hypothetical protein